MNYARCSRCRTLFDAGVAQRCFVCGVPLVAGGPGAARFDAPPSERQAGRDLGAVRILFAVFGVMGLGGGGLMVLNAASAQGAVLLLVLALVVVAGIGGVVLTRDPGTRFNEAGKVILNTLAAIGVVTAGLIATVVGLVVLLFMVCATGGLGRIGG